MNTSMDSLFAALADPTRRAILDRLRMGEASAGDLTRPFDLSQPAVSRHLRTLREAGLIDQRSVGTRRMFRLKPHRLSELDAWLDTFRANMETAYARLDTLLAQEDPQDDT